MVEAIAINLRQSAKSVDEFLIEILDLLFPAFLRDFFRARADSEFPLGTLVAFFPRESRIGV